ncbi:uncharacterized protein [Phyllobates terribilis]|uniref:uncharacterized protein isoform X6 n=1 Tax=Phyllobates terribilis TaxID=111132 RepID=UPI003CCB3A41
MAQLLTITVQDSGLSPSQLQAGQEENASSYGQIFEQPRPHEGDGGKVQLLSQEVDDDDEIQLPESQEEDQGAEVEDKLFYSARHMYHMYICTILQNFEDSTKMVSHDDTIISITVPLLCLLKRSLLTIKENALRMEHDEMEQGTIQGDYSPASSHPNLDWVTMRKRRRKNRS